MTRFRAKPTGTRTRTLTVIGAAMAVAATSVIVTNVQAEPREAGLGSCQDSGDGYGVCVTMPVDGKPDETISNNITEHIDATKAGDSIRLAMYEWELKDDDTDGPEKIADAIIAAHERDVDVEAIIGDTTDLHDGEDRSKKLRDTFKASKIPFEVCLDACKDVSPDNRGGAMHNKFFLIDHKDGGNTILQSSANLNEVQARSPQNLIISRDDDTLFKYLTKNWNTLADKKLMSDREKVGDKKSKAYVFRREEGTGDPFMAILKHVTECTKDHNKVWLTASGTVKSEDVLSRLAHMQDEMGCDVRVNVSVNNGENEKFVEDAGIDKDKAMSLSRNHNKLLYVDATYNDKTEPVVFAGSYNALDGGTSRLRNDEVMLRCSATDVTGWYNDYFELMFDNASNRT